MNVSVNQRLNALIKSLDESTNTFAQKIEQSGESVRLMVVEKRQVSSKTLKNIAKFLPNVNIEWLKTGKGSMLKEASSSEEEKSKSNSEEDTNDLRIALTEARVKIASLEKENTWLRGLVERAIGGVLPKP
jgi:phage repressor protein C with HTH and peptisase S24 domain